MEYGKAFSFVREDEKGITKLLIGGAISFLGGLILPLFLLWGYSLEITQNVAAGSARPLPEWDLIEDKFRKGINVFAIRLVYYLPIILGASCFAIFFVVLAASTGSSSARGSANSGAGPIGGIFGVLYSCFICIAVVYGIVASLLSDVAVILYASSGQLNDVFKFRQVLAFAQAHLADLIMTLVLTLATTMVGSIAAVITCFLGSPFVTAWVDYGHAHLLGQILRKAGLPLAPPAVVVSGPSLDMTSPMTGTIPPQTEIPPAPPI
jgi:hypothetical protein